MVRVRSAIPGTVEHEVFVDLVGHGQDVVGATQLGYLRQLVGAEDLPGRIVGRVEEEKAGTRSDGRGQLVGVEGPVGRVEPDQARDGAGHGRAGGVGVVRRLEHHHFVARLAQRQERGGDGLGGAGGHQHLVVG
jgi:hypothetical protein